MNGNFKYKCIPEYGATLISSDKSVTTINVPEEIEGYHVRGIGMNAFQNSAAEELRAKAPLVCIGENSFEKCSNLETVQFPESLLYIGPKAFADCTRLERIDLSAGCVTIESKAFSGCTALTEVILPEGLRYASDSAFDGDCKALFICPEGSYASEWAGEMGFRHKEI